MCGIFGYFNLNDSEVFYDIGKYSETRGKEASGYININQGKQQVQKFPLPFSDNLVKKNILSSQLNKNGNTLIGHTRLKTHGDEGLEINNQPVISNKISVVHNGILVNYSDLVEEYKLNVVSELDSEVIPLLISHHLEKNNLLISLTEAIKAFSGEISIAGSINNGENYFLYTNTGSLYFVIENNKVIFFTSEEWITKKIKEKYSIKGEIKKLQANTGLIINSEFEIIDKFKEQCLGIEKNVVQFDDILKRHQNREIIKPVLIRCKKCILPQTVPFIEFYKNDICNYCTQHKQPLLENFEVFKNILKNEKNIVVGFSGGRDSSYGLGILKNSLDSNFVAVSYDWGMVTDLARRNQARVVGNLGVEHVWVSANISKKRKNIKKNFLAWLSKPNIGLVPLLMAGDKEWQKQLFNAASNKQTNYVVQFQSPFEHTYFKYGFAGVKPVFSSKNISSKVDRYYMIFKLGIFYLKSFILNPRYFNSSFFDTIKGFFSYYFQTRNIVSLFEYKEYNEDLVNKYLFEKFMWECDPSTPTTWRIGDGTSPIYNYIYWIYAGFTENDFYRSNQIREGHLTREEALNRIHYENQPRFDLIKNYCQLIDVDYDFVIDNLNNFKKESIVKNWEKNNEK